MKMVEQVKTARCGMFASRDTLKEALEFSLDLASASESPTAVMTAVYVVLNTIAEGLDDGHRG